VDQPDTVLDPARSLVRAVEMQGSSKYDMFFPAAIILYIILFSVDIRV
jgi:hypothetical protein